MSISPDIEQPKKLKTFGEIERPYETTFEWIIGEGASVAVTAESTKVIRGGNNASFSLIVPFSDEEDRRGKFYSRLVDVRRTERQLFIGENFHLLTKKTGRDRFNVTVKSKNPIEIEVHVSGEDLVRKLTDFSSQGSLENISPDQS